MTTRHTTTTSKVLLIIALSLGCVWAQTGSDLTERQPLGGDASSPYVVAGSELLRGCDGASSLNLLADQDWQGNSLTKYLGAPHDGEYVFWISGDGKCELWLSTDTDPANAVKIASIHGSTGPCEWDKYPEEQSASISLVAGGRYYMMIQRTGQVKDHLAVGWRLPDGTLERPIPNTRMVFTPWKDFSSWRYSEDIYLCTTPAGASVSETVHDFPVLIRLHGSEFSFDDWARPHDGGDIRFALPDGMPLHYEIEQWNNQPGTADDYAAIWVLIPTIEANSDEQYITMYWGRPGAPARSSSSAVFSNVHGHAAVWHMADAPSDGGHQGDASPNGVDLTAHNFGDGSGGAIDAAGVAGRGVLLDDLNDYFTAEDNDVLEPRDNLTLSCWINTDSADGGNTLFMNRNADSPWYAYFLYLDWGHPISGRPKLMWANQEGQEFSIVAKTPISSNTWHHIAAQRDGSTLRIYVDGVDATNPPEVDGTAGLAGQLQDAEWGLRVGSENGTNFKYHGLLDELRISSSARSAGWVKLCYENQKPNQSLVWFGAAPVLPLNAPSQVVASADANGFHISWDDRCEDEDGFEILHGVDSTALEHLATVDANTTSYFHQVAECDTKYWFGVKAFADTRESLTKITASPTFSMPCVPTGLTATPVSQTEISLHWMGTSPAYVLEASTGSEAWTEVATVESPAWLHQGLVCHTTYYYRVRGVNPTGQSTASMQAQATTHFCPIHNPTSLTADNSVPDQISLRWQDNADNEAGYRVVRGMAGAGMAEIAVLPANTAAYVDRTVECDREYSYYVEAFDSHATSEPSNTVVVKTLYCGAGKSTAEMVSISGMFLDDYGEPFTGVKANVLVRFYADKTATEFVYEESLREVAFRNGYFILPVGLTKDVATVVRAHPSLFYDILVDGASIFSDGYEVLTASPYSIKTAYNLHGAGSPVGVISAPVGASYVDTDAKRLYMKAGTTDEDWFDLGQ